MSESPSLSNEDKARLCSGLDMWNLEAITQLGLDSVMVTDGPHGLRKQSDSGGSVPATCFPTAAGLAATWNPQLVHDVGQAIGREALAEKVAVVLGPGANIKRHPLCGRNFEYFSEDPVLTGHMAAALIDGIQSVGVGASIKHYAANNQEQLRMVLDTIVDERTMREIYLAGFEIAIKASQPWTVMCAYNKLDGVYCSENRWLLTDVLRTEWGFEGLVMTDWGATNDRVAGVRAGLDLEMPGSGGLNDQLVDRAAEAGTLDQAALDLVANRNIKLIRRGNDALASAAPVDLDANHDLARRAAAESHVLLSNDGILPLVSSGSVAVIGGFATEPRYQGAGSSQIKPTRVDTFLDSMNARSDIDVCFARGYNPKSDEPAPELIDEATLVARSADVAVVLVGLPGSYESEGFDRDHIRMPPQHNTLVREVVAANPNTVVVLCNGSAVQIPWVDQPRAIVEAFLAGQAGGSALVDVLFGAVNPSGKLSETFPIRQSDHASDGWYGGGVRQVQHREGVYVGYRWFDSAGLDVLYPFGHGLSYTTFSYGDCTVRAASTEVDADSFAVELDVAVTNTGDRAGAEVVQVYVRDNTGAIDRPDRELRAFDKAHLEPGETKVVSLSLDRRAFAFYDVESSDWQVAPGTFEILVGSSSRDIRSTVAVELNSTFSPAANKSKRPTLESMADDAAFEAKIGHPIQPEVPTRPFHRNSTLGDVADNPIGAGLLRGAEAAAIKEFGSQMELDDQMKHLVKAVMAEAPLRSMVLLSGGKMSWKNLDRLIGVLQRIPPRSGKKNGKKNEKRK